MVITICPYPISQQQLSQFLKFQANGGGEGGGSSTYERPSRISGLPGQDEY